MPESLSAPVLVHNLWLLFCAGLGMLFVGVRLISANIQRLAGGRIRELIALALGRPGAPQALGFISGLITQSGAAVTFAATGLVSAGAATLAVALPMIPWANVGTVVLAMLAAFNLRVVVYAACGVIGLLVLTRLARRETVLYLTFAALGLMLVLFGMSLLREAALSLRADAGLTAAMAAVAQSLWLALLVGGLFGALAQSALIVSIVAVPLVQTGLMSLEGFMPMMYAASLGTGLGQYLQSGGMPPAPRQLLVGGLLIRVISSSLLLTAFLVERELDLPLVAAAARGLTADPALQCGLVYLLVQLLMALVCQLLRVQLADWSRRWVPVPVDAVPASMRPAFVYDAAAEDTELALGLAEQEFARLVGLLPGYLEMLRDPAERPVDALDLERRHAGSTAIADRMDAFLALSLEAGPASAHVRRLFALRGHVGACRMLQASLHDLAREMAAVPPDQRPPLVHSLVEGLHAVLVAAADAWAAHPADPESATWLRELLAPRGALMDSVRKALMSPEQGFSGRESLLTATLHFEMCLWLLQSLVPSVPSSGED